MTRSALIVAHGSPSDPDPQEAALKDLAARVAALLPGWRIGGATLAKPGAFDAAVAELGTPWVYPYFMARGYFTKKILAERSEPFGLRVLEPFGTEPALVASAAHALRRELDARGWQAGATTLLVAAHGSAVSRTSAESARDFAAALKAELGFAEARAGYVEESPFLADSARGLGQAICLPQFAINAGHMLEDVPEALQKAAFAGPALPAFIDWPETPELIAQSLEKQASSA